MENDRLSINRLPSKDSSAADRNEKLTEEQLAQIRLAIGRRIVELFGTENYSEIGRHLQITAKNTSLYVTGARFPSDEVLLSIRRITGASIDWIYTGEGNKYVSLKASQEAFTPEEEQEIFRLASENGRNFLEQVAKLASAGLKFLEKLNSWKRE